jgi:hypothetical protein
MYLKCCNVDTYPEAGGGGALSCRIGSVCTSNRSVEVEWPRQSIHKIGSLFTFSGGRSRRKVNASQGQDSSIYGKGACFVPSVSVHLIVTQQAGDGIHDVGEPSRPG